MIDYTLLKVLWWVIMGVVLIIYATTAGFDLGVTMIMPFLRKETHRRIALNTSAPTWDGNQTWLVFIGGGLFVTWPVVFGTSFSGLYAAFLLVLWPFFLRPPGYEYRNKINSHLWRRLWDVALLISAFFPTFIFGVAMGNALLGFPFHFDPINLREFYTGNFWGLLSGFGVLCGFVSVFMLLMHGSVHLARRTEGKLHLRCQSLHLIFSGVVLILFTYAGHLVRYKIMGYTLVSSPLNPTYHPLANVVTRQVGAWMASYKVYPWKVLAPILVYLSITASLWAGRRKAFNASFWFSVLAVGSIVATAGFALFPFLMPSSTNPNESLTVWNATSSQYALNMMLHVGVFLLIIILAYKIFAYRSIWHKKPTINEQDLEDNEHTFY